MLSTILPSIGYRIMFISSRNRNGNNWKLPVPLYTIPSDLHVIPNILLLFIRNRNAKPFNLIQKFIVNYYIEFWSSIKLYTSVEPFYFYCKYRLKCSLWCCSILFCFSVINAMKIIINPGEIAHWGQGSACRLQTLCSLVRTQRWMIIQFRGELWSACQVHHTLLAL